MVSNEPELFSWFRSFVRSLKLRDFLGYGNKRRKRFWGSSLNLIKLINIVVNQRPSNGLIVLVFTRRR